MANDSIKHPVRYGMPPRSKPSMKERFEMAARVVKLRRRLKLPRNRFALLLKVSTLEVLRWEKGRNLPNVVYRDRIAELEAEYPPRGRANGQG